MLQVRIMSAGGRMGAAPQARVSGRTVHVLCLGAGVQSTALYLKACEGEYRLDAAIFADTQDEPAAVYRHLEWLQSLQGPPILIRTCGRLGDDLARGVNSRGQRFAAIPAYTTPDYGATIGRTKRQCSKEYKVEIIERTIRREIVGLEPKRRLPRGVNVHQYFGISLDEAGRAQRLKALKAKPNWHFHFPLIEAFWTRADCLTYLAPRVPHETPRSACVYCPFHSDAEWLQIKSVPEDWSRAVEIDAALRAAGSIANRDMRQQMYVHRSCKPLDLVQFDARPRMRDLQMPMSFAAECLGVCGV